jgi:hypothetical protein
MAGAGEGPMFPNLHERFLFWKLFSGILLGEASAAMVHYH